MWKVKRHAMLAVGLMLVTKQLVAQAFNCLARFGGYR